MNTIINICLNQKRSVWNRKNNFVILTTVLSSLVLPSCSNSATRQTVEHCPSFYDSALHKQIFTHLDNRPEFPGGDNALASYLLHHYRILDTSEGFIGTFLAEIIINEEGKVISVTINNKKSNELTNQEKEMKVVILSFPNFVPAQCGSTKVAYKYDLPIRF